jgi:hypothetical protein
VKLLCGISDGRGKICGRRLGPGTWERWVGVRNVADIALEGEHSVVSMCPKHGVVAIEKAEFETAQRDGSVAVHFVGGHRGWASPSATPSLHSAQMRPRIDKF